MKSAEPNDWSELSDEVVYIYRFANCDSAIELAHSKLDIPRVMTAENLSSPDLDELSGMTYLSYFMADPSPGFQATLQWVKSQVDDVTVNNFDVRFVLFYNFNV